MPASQSSRALAGVASLISCCDGHLAARLCFSPRTGVWRDKSVRACRQLPIWRRSRSSLYAGDVFFVNICVKTVDPDDIRDDWVLSSKKDDQRKDGRGAWFEVVKVALSLFNVPRTFKGSGLTLVLPVL